MNDYGFELKNDTRNFIINKYFEDKEIKQNRDYDVLFVEIGNTQNLSGYILVKQNFTSVSTSKMRKKSKSHYSEVIFAGLRQPTKEISISTYTTLSFFIKRFKISNMDICYDGLSEVEINKSNLYKLTDIFKEYINSFKDIQIEKTSFYINNPSSRLIDTDKFLKMLVYDKYQKESRYKKLDDELKDWKRLEVTLNIQFKLKGFNLDDYLEDVQAISAKYFKTSSFSYEYLDLQTKLLTDRRTQKGLISL
ncbi:MAG: hypothetical protein C0628_07065 [Sulfurimonas sp.]|nr:MAG: hypothetical protein C0628_07065 [Sulfurimonas sp.]